MVCFEQVNTLLNIGGLLLNYIRPMESANVPGSAPQIDPSTKMAAETTFIKVCNTLDSILDERSRWTMKGLGKLEKALHHMYAANEDFIETQTQAAYLLTCPHSRFRPTLAKLSDGNFAAILGDISKPETAIIGIGPSAEAALLNFDEVFTGREKEQILAVTQQEQKHEQEKLDDGRAGAAPRDEEKRKKPRRNRKGPGPKSDLG